MSHVRWWLGAMVTAAAGGATTSCMLVDGDGDYKVGIISSEAGEVGTVSSDAGPEASRSDTGAGDAASSHPDAGEDSGAAPCSTGVLNVSELMPTIQACMLLRGCFPPDQGPISGTVSQCVTYDEPHINAGLSCSTVTNAGCSDMAQCFGNGYDFSDTDCSATELSAKCIGNEAVICGVDGVAGVNEYYDCDIRGGTCAAINLEGNGGAPDYGGCVVVPACSDPSDTEECSGTTYSYTCVNGMGFGQDCASRTETCETRSTSGCYFHDDMCGATTSITCNASTGVISDCENGYVETYDCSKNGLGCALDSSNNAYCLAPGCAPTTSCTPSCDADGETIHLCIGGAPLAVDCASLFYDPASGTTFSGCLDLGSSSAPDPVCE